MICFVGRDRGGAGGHRLNGHRPIFAIDIMRDSIRHSRALGSTGNNTHRDLARLALEASEMQSETSDTMRMIRCADERGGGWKNVRKGVQFHGGSNDRNALNEIVG